MPPRLRSLTVQNLRSVREQVTIDLPDQGPLVILGENNAGKSNITRAFDILFGERWPGNYSIEENDFYGGDSDGLAIKVGAIVDGMPCPYNCDGSVKFLRWDYSSQSDSSTPYSFSCTVCSRTFCNKAIHDSLFAMSVGADRRLSYQLSYASQWTMLSKLMHRFHKRLIADPARKRRLEQIYESLKEQFDGVTEFNDFRNLLAESAQDFGQNLAYRLDIDFVSYDPTNFFRSLKVHPHLDGVARSFDELGTGQEQILALAFAYAYAKSFGGQDGLVLLIDEPESNLHPLAQQWLASRLSNLSTEGLQIVVTTHSPHFVDLLRPENLVLVRKPNGESTTVKQVGLGPLVARLIETGADPDRTTTESVGRFYSANATTEIVSGLFSRLCVLVEGPTEAFALPSLLKLVGFDPLRAGIAIVPAGGISQIAKWRRLFDALGMPVYCVFDTDSDKRLADDPVVARGDIFRSMKLDPGNAERERVSDDPLHVQPLYATLNTNFESAISSLIGDVWTKKYAESALIVGAASKSLRARYAADLLTESDLSPNSKSALEELARALSALLTEPEPDGKPQVSSDTAPGDWEPPF